MANIEYFKETIYRLCEEGKDDEAIDFIFQIIDDLHWASNFQEVDLFLKTIDLEKINKTIGYAILGITFCAKADLKYRRDFEEKFHLRYCKANIN